MPILDTLLDDSARDGGTIKLYTSELSRVEVAFANSEKKQGSLDEETERRIDGLWTDPSAVVLVEYHDGVGREARTLMRNAIAGGWSLKPLDAIHLATARWLSTVVVTVEEFHTYDRGLYKYGPIVGFKVMEPVTLEPKLF